MMSSKKGGPRKYFFENLLWNMDNVLDLCLTVVWTLSWKQVLLITATTAEEVGAGKYRNGVDVADGPDVVRVRFRVGDRVLGLG